MKTVRRAVASYHPASMPVFTRAAYRRELAAWSLLPMMVAVVEGGVTGVVVKNLFEGVVSATALNLSVAIIAGGPALANIASFVWSALTHGRNKIRCLWYAQLGAVLLVSMIALAPVNAAGLAMVVAGMVGARVCWTGVMLLRTAVWRANYPRHIRATITGNLATVQSLVMMLATLAMGFAITMHSDAFRVLYPVGGGLGLLGAWVYRNMRMRGQPALLRQEQADESGGIVNPLNLRRVLLQDAAFRRYMTAMFVFGAGNLMVLAPMVVVLKDRFGFDALISVLIVTSIPMLVMPACVPLWSKLLSRVHIVQYRAVHSWSYVTFISLLAAAAIADLPWLLFISALLNGVANAGGVLGWNLGHHDFAPPEKAGQYMSLHVTLTGIRGLTAPVIAISLYQVLEWWQPGRGVWVFAVCGLSSLTGAISFAVMARTMRRRQIDAPDPTDFPPSSRTVRSE